MTPRPFLLYPDPRLLKPAAPVDTVDDRVREIWAEMLTAMYDMPGVGLAAPQLGVGLRLAVVDCSDGKDQPIRMANPEILSASEETRTHKEGSPNIPGIWENVTRPAKVRLRYLNEAGAGEERDFEDLWATSAQHQIDHLNGVLFIERLRPVKRRMVLDKLKKQRRRQATHGGD